jgi:hypothetical protein
LGAVSFAGGPGIHWPSTTMQNTDFFDIFYRLSFLVLFFFVEELFSFSTSQ